MKLTVVSMVKNEADVIQGFSEHLSALFDRIVIIDHRSRDGTREYLEKVAATDSRFQILKFDEPGYFQSQLMTWAAKTLEACTDADWVFFLDADEVLPFTSRAEFEAALDRESLAPIIRLQWKNLVPADFASASLFNRKYFLPARHAQYFKIAYQPKLLPVSDFVIAQGNHAILAGRGGGELPSKKAFSLYHVPLRDREQIGLKIIQGVNSYLKMGETRDQAEGLHWFMISERIVEKGMSDELLHGLVASYGEDLSHKKLELSAEELLEQGYREFVLDSAQKPIAVEPRFNDIYSEKIIKTVMDYTRAEPKMNCRDNHETLELTEDNRIVINNNFDLENFTALEPLVPGEHARELQSLPDAVFLSECMAPSYWTIETLTPTAWGGHIPFMYVLMNMLRPRRYVELGSHHGASFFAACQAMQEIGYSGKAVAIDLWAGDEHTGKYGEEVFNNFSYLLKARYANVGGYLRMDFNEAAARFEDRSIDLLHIDGLHTYEAVKNDFLTWKDKVTENGVILFHDTQERENDFGVWKLWDEITPDYVSYEFQHTHGLGIICMGSDPEHPVVRLLTLLNQDERLAEGFERHFARVGALSTEQAFHKLRARTESAKQPDRPGFEAAYAYGRMDKLCDRLKAFVRKYRLGRFF